MNCAGHLTETPIADISDAEWRRMLRVHLGGTWHTCREVAPRMAARGRGAIVNTSSELALCGAELHAHYCAAKGAIVGLTKSLALELAGRGVRVNAVAPGATDTALLTDTWRTPEYLGSLPLRRLSTPAEIAAIGRVPGLGRRRLRHGHRALAELGRGDMRVALVTGAATGIGAATADLLERRGLARGPQPPARPVRPRLLGAGRRRRRRRRRRAWSSGCAPTSARSRCSSATPRTWSWAGSTRSVPTRSGSVIDTNLTGSFNCIRACAPAMTGAGFGRIVTIASGWGVTGWPRASAYSASKAGLISMTRAVARELGPHGVTANAIAPGVVDTPQLDVDAGDAGVTPGADPRPLRRPGAARPGRPARARSRPSSPTCAARTPGTITGQVVRVAGGAL